MAFWSFVWDRCVFPIDGSRLSEQREMRRSGVRHLEILSESDQVSGENVPPLLVQIPVFSYWKLFETSLDSLVLWRHDNLSSLTLKGKRFGFRQSPSFLLIIKTQSNGLCFIEIMTVCPRVCCRTWNKGPDKGIIIPKVACVKLFRIKTLPFYY